MVVHDRQLLADPRRPPSSSHSRASEIVARFAPASRRSSARPGRRRRRGRTRGTARAPPAGRERDRRLQARAGAGRAVDVERPPSAATRSRQAAQARALAVGVGAADAVVGDLRHERGRAAGRRSTRHARGARVLDRVRDRLADEVVDGDLDRPRAAAGRAARSISSGERRAVGERASAGSSPYSASPAGCRPRASSRSSGRRLRASSRRVPRACSSAVGGAPARACGARARCGAERDEPLLHAVVEVAADAAALLVGGRDEPGARGGDLGLALAQGGLVAAALDLGAGPRGEDPQRGRSSSRGVERAACDITPR